MEESYKLVEIIIDTITNDWMPIINKFFNSTITFFSDYGIFVLIGVIIYLYWTYWYWRHARAAVENIYIAPVSVKGGIAEQLGSRETGLILWSQLTQIAEVFSEERRGHASLYMAAVLGDRFRGMGQVLNLGNESYRINKEELEKSVLLEEFSINVGSIKIPIGAIINFFLAIFRVIPVFFRKKYYSFLIIVTVISVKN